MTTRRKLNLINGTMGQEGSILMYQTENIFEVACAPGRPSVPPLPFPHDDDDGDNFDQADEQDR